jgi:hypothetical protein
MPLNPIAYTEQVVANYLRYQLSAYPFADQHLFEQMRQLLSLDQTRATPLLRGPYIKLSRSFKEGATVKELVKGGVLHPLMQSLIKFPRVHAHQERAIRSIASGRTTLVSTGTGSGKTETFLYPIISRCLRLRDENAAAGIVAVLVYPMNALAEDQLGRLRGLLAGTGVSFGMYVGKTPERRDEVTGERLGPGASAADYEQRLAISQRERRGTAVHPFEERCSREEMRTPGQQPRILLTNVKQLELLLTRQADIEMFDGARLEFLVFDEAHTFSGTTGAETACLIRRLRAFCGRSPEQTVCVGTSATLTDGESGQTADEFACRFFGVDPNAVSTVKEEYAPDLWAHPRVTPGPLEGTPLAHLKAVLEALSASEDTGEKVATAFRAVAGRSIDADQWKSELHRELVSNDLVFGLAAAVEQPTLLSDAVARLTSELGREIAEEEMLLWLLLGAAAERDGRPLLRPVVHAFVRGIPGAVVTFPPGQERPKLWLSAEDERAEGGETPFARLPVTACSTCGQHYFVHHLEDFAFTDDEPEGGQAVHDRRVWRPLAPESGGHRVVLVDRVVGTEEDEDDHVPGVADVFLCRHCGAVHPADVRTCDHCGREKALVVLMALRQDAKRPGFLLRCISCKAVGRARGADSYREPARPVRAVNVSDVFVLAQDMLRFAERRRLLIFADNRQDAAFQDGWMRDHARRFRLRALMAQRITQSEVSVGDLASHLDQLLDQDDELSRALVPEIWTQHPKASEPTEHAQERKYYLRIQVLREVATGVKQRIGLEPWGRLKVRYAGLDETAPFVIANAPVVGVSPSRLADGIAQLLDRFRRTLFLLDRQGLIYSRFWKDGAREIQRSYLPLPLGGPKGLKLHRRAADDKGRITQWLSAAGQTSVRQAVVKWGVKPDDVDGFVEALWRSLTDELALLAPVTLKNQYDKAVPGTSGAFQIDADKLLLTSHNGLWRCNTCRRTQVRTGPHDRCPAWRCDGVLAFEPEREDNYDLNWLDGGTVMVRSREHSAQVPADERERIERVFKSDEGEHINTLVCTPTLELGVDIGSLDTVLMRNVPPLPANYWQRAGRAGRRHRMAVNLTYARPTSHDRAYFAEPLKLLLGAVEPPRFNLRNDLMVRRHVHAAVVTRLHQLVRKGSGLPDNVRAVISSALESVFPSRISHYLFDEQGRVRTKPYDVSALGAVLGAHRADLNSAVNSAFGQGWPAAEQEVVSPSRLAELIEAMPRALEDVVRTLRRRLTWALDQIRRLDAVRLQQGTLEPDDDALFRRCDQLVKRYKGQSRKLRQDAEGYDDINTLGVLAAEGFLPGYGLERGAVLGLALMPRVIAGATDLALPRPTAVALREFVPGNLIYANSHRFVPRQYHLIDEQGAPGGVPEPLVFQVDPKNEAVLEMGTGSVATLGAGTLLAVPMSDVDMVHQSRISDEEDNRFQLSVACYGYERDQHGGGQAYRWGDAPLQFRRGVHLRLVNVGASRLLDTQLGYPLCVVCGQSRSPLSSQAERQKFAEEHQKRCGRAVAPTGFFADIVADALSLPGCKNAEAAYSIAESLRLGASQILEMDRDDLEVLVIRDPGLEEACAILYDPMPGGSGLLHQLCDRFGEVCAAAVEALTCPSSCERSCIDCLQIFRNVFFHRHLDRHVALEAFNVRGAALVAENLIPAKLPVQAPQGDAQPVNDAEATLRRMLLQAGFPEGEWQKKVDLGKPMGVTVPDCFFALDDEPGICIYLDGMSGHLHGNPSTQQRDAELRTFLRNSGYSVFEITATQLGDRDAMVRHFQKLGRLLVGAEKAKQVKDDTGWFEL